MAKTIDMAKVEEIAKTLQAAPKLPPGERVLTTREAVAKLTPQIRGMQRRGYTLDQVAEVLKKQGLALKVATLKGYLRPRRRKARAEVAKA